MHLLDIVALLVSLTALLAYANHRWLRLPTTIGVMLIALLLSLALIAAGELGYGVEAWAERIVGRIDFSEALMHGMLSFLLFAGALHVDLNDLARQKFIIGTLATAGIVLSTFLVGTALWLVLPLAGFTLPYIWCLVFGALISPTDPIAVLGILKSARVPKSLEVKVAGESLFNDGVGVVVFLVLVGIATKGGDVSAGAVAGLFALEALGGALLGLGLGTLAYWMLKSVDSYQVEVLLTLALVMGGYSLALALHTSGPIAIVVAGLFIGNQGRRWAMSETTREHLDTFWELVDEILNAVLFVLLGLEILVLSLRGETLVAGLLAIPIVLLARWVSVSLPVRLMRRLREFTPGAITVMTWGGLRGGISVALALSLPAASEARELLVAVTYVVVVFSILVQGLSVGAVVRRVVREDT
ncbi:MAG: sodium:proton antiporter [Burkholderiales bacterium]|nr:sodium:proton antiporter [Burkholderiales bacterium]